MKKLEMDTVSIERPIPGFDNYYISDRGIVTNSKGRIIKPEDNGKGYLYVNLCQNSKITHIAVHKLLAITFCYNANPEENEVLHMNGDRQKNTLDNIRWGTHKENMQDKLTRKRISESNKGRKLTEEHKANLRKAKKDQGSKAVYCLELDKTFDSITKASEELGLDTGNISKVCNGRRKTTGGYHFKFC